MSVMVDPATADAVFATLLQRHRGAALQLLRRLCPGDAEDVLQEALAKAWRYRQSFVADASDGRAWLLQAAFRTFLDHRRRRAAPTATDPAVLAARPAPSRCPAAARDDLARALLPLQPIERQILLGFHGDRCTLQELAARFALPVNTVKSHLHRARRKLARSEDGDA